MIGLRIVRTLAMDGTGYVVEEKYIKFDEKEIGDVLLETYRKVGGSSRSISEAFDLVGKTSDGFAWKIYGNEGFALLDVTTVIDPKQLTEKAAEKAVALDPRVWSEEVMNGQLPNEKD